MSQYLEPFEVAQRVEQWVTDAFSSVRKYDNSELLDASMVYDLHQLAAEVYRMGHIDGKATAAVMERERRSRELDAKRAEAEDV